jgi:maltooligosyltrehalose trehalohydrolase
MIRTPMPGATITDEGVHYCVWAPAIERVSVEIESAGEVSKRALILEKQDAGYHLGLDADGKAGDAYAYRLDAGPPLPDPASRAQEGDVHGRSLVVDPNTYRWEDTGWKRPRFRDLVIYELHRILPFLRNASFIASRIMIRPATVRGANA